MLEASAKIKVVGIGGSGLNTVDRMIRLNVQGVEFVAIDSDIQILRRSLAKRKIHVGKTLTQGFGTGMDLALGARCAEESRAEIQEAVKNSDILFVTCGLGGGIGTGVIPVVAKISKDQGSLTVAIVTKPFNFEGFRRAQVASQGMKRLLGVVDATIVIPNDRILTVINEKTSFFDAFKVSTQVLYQAIHGIVDIIAIPGIINLDCSDLSAVLKNSGLAIMGVGLGKGGRRAIKATKDSVNSLLAGSSIKGAQRVLFNIASRSDMTLWEINRAVKIIVRRVDFNAKIIFGITKDERLKGDEVRVTVIASGLPLVDYNRN